MIPENTHSLRKLLPSLSLSLSIKKKRERGGGWGIKTFLLDVINARDFPRWRMGGGGHLSVQLNRRKAQGRMQEQTVPRGACELCAPRQENTRCPAEVEGRRAEKGDPGYRHDSCDTCKGSSRWYPGSHGQDRSPSRRWWMGVGGGVVIDK